MSIRIIVGDVREKLRDLPAGSVHCVVTSPPYFGLRDYRVDGQIGLEPTPAEYVAALVDVFREVRRVLRDDGTLWLNLGDSYDWSQQTGGLNSISGNGKSQPHAAHKRETPGLKPKDLIGIPWRVAFALQADGWWLRNDNIWAKPNPMPESVTDRCTKAHEYIFMLTKSERYFYDADAIAEPAQDWTSGGPGTGIKETNHYSPQNGGNDGLARLAGKYKSGSRVATRNRRTVWTIASQPFPEAHFATFPPALPELCIKAGTSERGCCAKCGAPWERIVQRTPSEVRSPASTYGNDAGRSDGGRSHLVGATSETIGWQPTCDCGGGPVRSTVLDPFGGSGTTALVADRLGRDAILIELNPDYAAIAENRIRSETPLFADVGG